MGLCSMRRLFYYIKSKFLTFFGDIKYFKFPFFLVYDPDEYLIDGEKTRDIMRKIKPGDLILRKYRHYLDGLFIPGKYSHTGIYIGNGKVIHAIAEGVSKIDLLDFVKCDYICILRPKEGQKEAIEKARECCIKGIPYDFSFKEGDKALYCHELGAVCYKNLNIEKKTPILFNGLIKSKTPRWLAESFLTSPDFKLIAEY